MDDIIGDNLTAVLYKPFDLRLEKRPIPQPEDNDVLLRISKVGICGTDISYYTKGRCANVVVNGPMLTGHEASGVVIKCGRNVDTLKPGDRVAIEPGVPCRMCEFCKGGRYNICKKAVFHRNLAQYYKHPADFCYKLPDHVSMEEGSLLEPLSVAVYACQKGEVGLGSRVLITGAGPIGLLTLLVCNSLGASQVCITDIQDYRLEIAKSYGAHSTLNVFGKTPRQIGQEVEQILGEPPDTTIECSGVESSVSSAIYATKSGGIVVLVGMGGSDLTLPITNAASREVDIRAVFRYLNCYPTALRLVASGVIDVKSLVTHRFTIQETVKAFEACRTGEGGAIKVMISC